MRGAAHFRGEIFCCCVLRYMLQTCVSRQSSDKHAFPEKRRSATQAQEEN